MYCYEGKQIDVWPNDDRGLWFYNPKTGHTQTVKEDRHEQAIPEGREDSLQDMGRTKAWCFQIIKPPYPTMVPKEERWVGNLSMETKREAHYIDKNINAWDDGKDYWQIKPDRIPKKWLELEVTSWGVWPASIVVYGSSRRNDYGHSHKNINFHGQRIWIEAKASGERLEVPEPKEKTDDQLEGQMRIEDWKYEVTTS